MCRVDCHHDLGWLRIPEAAVNTCRVIFTAKAVTSRNGERKKKIELIKQIFPLIKFSIVFLSIEYSGVNSTHATGGIASPPHLLIFSSFLSPHPSLSAAALHFTASSLSFSSFLLLIKLQLRFRHISFNWLRCALSSNPYFCLSILLTAPEHNHHFTSLIWPT